MTQKTIGPTFSAELLAAGMLGEHFTWLPDGTLEFFEDTPPAVVSAVEAVYAAHDPEAVPVVPEPTKADLITQLQALIARVEALP